MTVFLLFVCSTSVFSDEAFDFFVETCRHSGYNPAEISTFQAELKVVVQRVLPDSYVKRMRQEQEKEELPISGMDEEERQRSKEAWEEVRKQQYSSEPLVRSLKVVFNNSGTHIGLDDDLGQVIVIDLAHKDSRLFQVGSGIRDATHSVVGKDAKVGVNQSGSNTMVHDGSITPGMHYHLNGRAQSVETMTALGQMLVREEKGNGFIITDASKAAFKKLCEKHELSFTLSKEKMKYDRDYSSFVLEVSVKGHLREQLWIDSDRGYICPREKRFDSIDGSLREDRISENFMLDEHSHKWFPQKVTYSHWSPTGEEMVILRSEVLLTPGTLVLNQPIPDSVFSLTVQEGTRIDDARRDDLDKITFFANQTGTLDLPTIEKKSLDELEWLTSREVRQPQEPYPVEKASVNWTQIVLMSVGVIMIILGLIILFYKKSGTDI